MAAAADSPLLERDAEIETLTAAVQSAGGGEGALVVVSAEGGVGKTRLLELAAAAAARAEMHVLRARGAELERGFPFGVAAQLLRSELARAEELGLLSGIASLARPLLDREGDDGERAAVDAMIHGLGWFVADLAERRPLALVVDDAHWADETSLRVLLHLAHRVRDLPLLLLVATRPNEPGADPEFFPRLMEYGATPVHPRPLSAEAVGAYVHHWGASRAVDDSFVEACTEVTGGNPLLLRELLAALGEEGRSPDTEGAERARAIGPKPVSRAVDLVLRRLPAPAAAVTRAAAILGEGADLRAVATLVDTDLQAAAEAVALLEAAGVLTAQGAVGFVHPIVRAAVYEQVPASERGLMHARAASILRDDASADRVSAHLLSAPREGAGWVIETLRQASRQALARGVPSSAVTYLRRALQEPPPEDDRPQLISELGHAEAAAGEPRAAETLMEAADLATDPRARSQLVLEAGRVLVGFSRFEEAAELFETGQAELDGHDEALALELQAAWAASAVWIPSIGTSVMERVGPLLAPGREPRVHGERVLLATLAGLEGMRGTDREATLDWARRAWGDGALLEGSAPDDPVFPALTGGFAFAEAFEECDEVASAVIEKARSAGSAKGFATGCFARGGNSLFQGRIPDAVADLEQALAARKDGWSQYVPRAAGLLVHGQLLLGNADRAAEVADELPTLEAEHGHSPLWAAALEGMGHMALHRGDPERALAAWLAEGEITKALDANNPVPAPWRSNAGLALAQLGRRDEALALCDEEVELARRFGVSAAEARALRARGIAGGRAGQEDLRAAVDTAENSGSELQRCLARLSLGRVLRADGKRSEATELLRLALQSAETAGARAVAEQAREELRALGARPRRPWVTGVNALTPGELRVAQMAAAGSTNRQIAEDLFVTQKAVEWHLTNAYRKLGVSSREELSVALADATG